MRLPSEWERQAFVQLTFPHAETDWQPILDDVLSCYREIAKAITRYESLLVVASDIALARKTLNGLDNIEYIEIPTNDTWARDHAFITCKEGDERYYMDFQFNGWGLKFASNHDNQINKELWSSGILQGKYIDHKDFVLEGGSIESDGAGTLLTTSSCLLAPNRNNLFTKQAIEDKLCAYLHATRILWLDHGSLAGDDTDGHIDTLARLCPNDTIVYVTCDDEADEHYQELHLMEEELQSFRTQAGVPYKLVGMPLPDAIYDEGDRLPATYANFLIINGAVLCPTYGQREKDDIALSRLQTVFPDRDIIGIDSQVLIRQHGSLHCCTMQYPSK